MQATYEKLLTEVPKYKMISTSVLADRLRVREGKTGGRSSGGSKKGCQPAVLRGVGRGGALGAAAANAVRQQCWTGRLRQPDSTVEQWQWGAGSLDAQPAGSAACSCRSA